MQRGECRDALEKWRSVTSRFVLAVEFRSDLKADPPRELDSVPAVTAAPDRLPAAWQADEATGAVWLTADDAAQGQPGLSWSDPGATAGAVTSGSWAAPPTTAEESVEPPRAPAPTAAEDDDLR